MSDHVIVQTRATEQPQVLGTYQGRFGFHPTSREVYRKVKRLNFLLFMALRRDKEHARWARKQVQNRRLYKYHRTIDAVTGKPTHVHKEDVGPRPEPVVSGLDHWYETVLEDYRRARFPVPTPPEVKPLKWSEAQIDAALVEAEAWRLKKPE